MTSNPFPVAEALFGKARRAVLALLFGQPDRAFYTREIVTAARTGASQVQKELDQLTRAGLLIRERRANQVYFRANPEAPIFPELKGLVAKITW
jgi:DNA-binding transcriptional ArsR family regulator